MAGGAERRTGEGGADDLTTVGRGAGGGEVGLALTKGREGDLAGDMGDLGDCWTTGDADLESLSARTGLRSRGEAGGGTGGVP